MRRPGGKVFFILLSIIVFGMSSWVYAEFIPQVKEAVIYPNNLAFLVREGEANLVNGECVVDFLPPAIQGSLSVFTPTPGLILEQVITLQEPVVVEEPVHKLAQVFQLNIGKPVQLLADGQVVSGILKGFIEPAYLVLTVNNENGATTDEVYALDLITSYRFLEPVTLTQQQTEYTGKIKALFKGPAAQGSYPVGISYLQSGLSWSPEYIINLQAENYGEVSFSGVVRNDTDDLVATTLYLAANGPRFPRVLSPLVIFTPEQPAMYARGELSVMGVKARDSLEFSPGIELDDVASLMMYKKSEITLKKGERTLLPLFRGAVKTEPLYRLALSRSLYAKEVAKEPVWKVYRVYNDSTIPWIEGNVMLMMLNRPLGVGTLPYIAPGRSGEIRVMTDQEIKAEVKEIEFERVQSALVFQETEYSFVRINGEIELENTKNEAVMLKVTHLLPGEVSAVGEGGKAVKKATLQAGPNPSSEITWEILLPAQTKRKLTYTYQTYLPAGEKVPLDISR
ncbi:MAG: DUF4139 domain-containing protein [Firmicutes bacterium]|nr:DUF4139 domain-containing protein [Bacillota bacterium]